MARNLRREAQRNLENGGKLLALGSAFALAPLFLAGSPLGRALAPLFWLGLLMLVVGGALIWVSKHPDGLEPKREPIASRPRRHWMLTAREHRRSERTVMGLRPDVLDVQSAADLRPPHPPRPTAWSRAVFDVIEWRRFEALVESLFRQGGFETKSQSHGPDGGVDVWVYSRNMPGAPVSIIQCKHWRRRVGVDKVRELRGIMAAENVKRGQFVTTSTFTPDAIEFGGANSINLLDGAGLLALIARRSSEQQAALLEVALEGDYSRPTCVNCGVKMVERQSSKGAGGAFWGCESYPRCRNTMQMRSASASSSRFE